MNSQKKPIWKRNIGGIAGAVGYRDANGQIVIVTNWEALLFGRRAQIDLSAPRDRRDELLPAASEDV